VRRGGARPLSANLLLGALSLALSLLVAEGIVRLFDLGPPRGAALAQEPAQGDERRNSLGFRGPEWTPEPAAGTARESTPAKSTPEKTAEPTMPGPTMHGSRQQRSLVGWDWRIG
jgi:hypothetical protein